MAKRKSSGPPQATAGAKMIYLIKRRDAATREELLVHWFANHMPLVIKSQHDAAAAGRLHARRYIATLFDANAAGEHPWDGVAQLWWDQALPKPKTPTGTTPRDSFQEKAQPYVGWATKEYVVIDGSEHLPVRTVDAQRAVSVHALGLLQDDVSGQGESRRHRSISCSSIG